MTSPAVGLAEAPTPVHREVRLTQLLLWAIAGGAVMACTFAPAGWWWLAPVAYIPILWCWRNATPGRAALCGLAFGMAGFALICSWMWFFGTVAFVPFLIGMGAFPAITGYAIAQLRTARIRGPWIEAAVWVVFEGLRARVPFGGMPWATAGSALSPFAPARALAPYAGVLLVSFVLIAGNALLLDGATAWVHHARDRRRITRAGLGFVSVVLVMLVAWAAWPATAPTGRLRYALLQGNDLNRELTTAEFDENYLLQSHFNLAGDLSGHYDLIVFPESGLGGADPETDAVLRDEVTALARKHSSWVMLNVNEIVGEVTYNTNRIYDPDGLLVASYRKQHLVPFGEYLPFGWVKAIAPQIERIGSGYAPGEGSVTVPVAGHPLTTVICFESAFGALVRTAAADGAQALVLSTNNRSYRRSANSAQHVQLSQWRAAELGRPMLHAAISGQSAVVDPRGQVRQESKLFERTTLTGEIELRRGQTPYARFGDWFLLGCILASLGGYAILLIRTARTPRSKQS